MKRLLLSAFALCTAGAFAGACSLNPQPFPPFGGSQASNSGSPMGGKTENDASIAAGSDAASGDGTLTAAPGDAGGPVDVDVDVDVDADADAVVDAAVEARIEADVSDASAPDVRIEGGE